MARPRQKLDRLNEAGAVRRLLKTEPPGWRRERLLAVQLGLEGEQGLDQIAAAMGRARSTIQEWFDRYREGGVGRLLHDERDANRGAEGLPNEAAREQMEAGLRR